MALAAVVLAAGKGTRMKSNLPKVLHRVAGQSMIDLVLGAVTEAGAEPRVVVVGYEACAVTEVVDGRAKVVVQQAQLGTAHALLQAEELLDGFDGEIMVLPGDVPLVKGDTLRSFYMQHLREGASASVLTACIADPTGYGRVVRDAQGGVVRIVEDRDATADELLIKEINTGVYCFGSNVFPMLRGISSDNAQGEYYLPDVIQLFRDAGSHVSGWEGADPEEFMGVNDRRQMAVAESIMRRRVMDVLMEEGVTVLDPAVTYVDPGVVVGPDTVLYPFSFLEGGTVVGAESRIGPCSRIIGSRLGKGVTVQNSVVVDSVIGDYATVGPFAYIRPESVIGSRVKVGDFVEIKKSTIGENSKVPHLSYIGDAQIGRNVNVGAGTITCNYDGCQKSVTIIEDGAFVGSNTNLVAPVRVGRGAYVGAGSTISKDVPAEALGIARNRQQNVLGWAKRNK